jgi:hypothetical protein
MENTNARTAADQPGWNKWIVPSAILVILILLGYGVYRAYYKSQTQMLLSGKTLVSQSTFEEQSGLQITLVAVTAAGGMVDIRFKVMDVEKAKKILQDEKKLPVLTTEGSNVSLKPAPETLQDVKLESGLIYYILYSNTGNLIKPGTPVSIVFGDLLLEPIIAK